MSFFVYYEDDYCENGGHGLKSCVNKEEAVAFIEDRLARSKRGRLDDYQLIDGWPMKLTAITVATKVEAKRMPT